MFGSFCIDLNRMSSSNKGNIYINRNSSPQYNEDCFRTRRPCSKHLFKMVSETLLFNARTAHQFLANNFTWTLYLSVAYVALLFFGKCYLATRSGWELCKPLLVWSTALAVFSILGAVRTAPHFVRTLNTNGFKYSLCSFDYFERNPVTGFWAFLFALSKIAELLDTAFIVLRKKKLIFLHWYHHFSVMVYTWYTFINRGGPGLWFSCMNFWVHSLMYSYYAISAAQIKVPKAVAIVITCAQLSQMVVGLVISLTVSYYWMEGQQDCQITGRLATFSVTIYGSYLVLFFNFFVQTYLKPNGSKKLKNP